VQLRPKVLKECQDAVVKTCGEAARFYLVSHGGSGSTQQKIDEALDYGVVKMNVDTDMQSCAGISAGPVAVAFLSPLLAMCS